MTHANRFRTAGFSLIELMIALALGVVVTAGVVQLFVTNNQTYALMTAQARLQENTRFSFDFIKDRARSAGYFGCGPEQQNVVNGLRGTWPMLYEFNVTVPVAGFEGNGDGTWTPALTELPRTQGAVSANVYIPGNGVDISAVAPGTDVLVFRQIRMPETKLEQVLQPLGDPVVRAPGGNAGVAVNDIVMVADCQQAAVFRITALNVAGNSATLLHATAASGDPYENATIVSSPSGPVPATLSFLGRSYGEDTVVGAVETSILFIAPSAGLNNRGDRPLSLWQKVGTAAPVELVAGVEDLQVLYGIDTTLGDNEPNVNQYVAFDAVPNTNQIVSLNVTITVNSVDEDADGVLLRRTSSETVLLRNSRPST